MNPENQTQEILETKDTKSSNPYTTVLGNKIESTVLLKLLEQAAKKLDFENLPHTHRNLLKIFLTTQYPDKFPNLINIKKIPEDITNKITVLQNHLHKTGYDLDKIITSSLGIPYPITTLGKWITYKFDKTTIIRQLTEAANVIGSSPLLSETSLINKYLDDYIVPLDILPNYYKTQMNSDKIKKSYRLTYALIKYFKENHINSYEIIIKVFNKHKSSLTDKINAPKQSFNEQKTSPTNTKNNVEKNKFVSYSHISSSFFSTPPSILLTNQTSENINLTCHDTIYNIGDFFTIENIGNRHWEEQKNNNLYINQKTILYSSENKDNNKPPITKTTK